MEIRSIRQPEWGLVFKVNDRPRGVKGWLAYYLRSAASWLDDRLTLSLTVNCLPDLPLSKRMECVKFGLNKMSEAMQTELISAAEERVLRESFDELFPGRQGIDLGEKR